jgi:hypothetical protein
MATLEQILFHKTKAITQLITYLSIAHIHSYKIGSEIPALIEQGDYFYVNLNS